MIEQKSKAGRLIALSLLGGVLFNYPILTLFNQSITWFGIPLFYIYIFSVWSVLIVAIGLITKMRTKAISPGASSSPDAPDPADRDQSC